MKVLMGSYDVLHIGWGACGQAETTCEVGPDMELAVGDCKTLAHPSNPAMKYDLSLYSCFFSVELWVHLFVHLGMYCLFSCVFIYLFIFAVGDCKTLAHPSNPAMKYDLSIFYFILLLFNYQSICLFI